jgi:hypothetical protein
MTSRTTSDGMSLRQSATTGVVRRGGGWFFLGRLASAPCASSWSARASRPRVLLRGAHDSLRLVLAGREVAWGRACRGGAFFFWAAGQRAVRGSLVSAGLGPRVVLCGAHDSLRLVLAGREVAWGRACRGGWVFFWGGWPARCARVVGQRGLLARGSCCVERTTRFASCWQCTRWRGGGRVVVAGSFFGAAGQRAVRGSLVSAGFGPAGLVVWSARLAAPRAW